MLTGQEWKHSYYQQCLVPVLNAICKPGYEYREILDLDRTIRDFPIPTLFRDKEKSSSTSMMMHQAFLGTALEAGELTKFSVCSYTTLEVYHVLSLFDDVGPCRPTLILLSF